MTTSAPPEIPAWLASSLPWRRTMVDTPFGRVHAIDEGEGDTVVLLHGNPTWSFLYRKVIAALFAKRTLRVVVPDLLGFGLSDKPRDPAQHTLPFHIDAVAHVLHALGVEDAIYFGQDWGGPIVVGAAARAKDIRGIVLGNTAVLRPARPFRKKAFHRVSHVPVLSDLLFRGLGFPIPWLHRVQGDPRSIGPDERRAYAFPFRDRRDRAGPLGLARMVPDGEAHPSTAALDGIESFLTSTDAPITLVWGRADPILGRSLARHRRVLPRAHVVETMAGHFLQEEVPDVIADCILARL